MDSFISRYEGIRYSHLLAVILIVQGLFYPLATSALPVFARQTGQNCVACHAGGQFPELTSYGRLFKLTGYICGVSVPGSQMIRSTDLRRISLRKPPSGEAWKIDIIQRWPEDF